MMSLPALLGIGTALMLAQMTALWKLHLPRARRPLANAAWVDVGWAGGFGVLAVLYALFGAAPGWRRALLAALVCAWSFRLAVHLYRDRVAGGREEDKRYGGLRPGWGARAPFYFLLVFLGQGLLDVALSIPFLLIARNPGPFSMWEGAGFALWVLGLAGESLADAQLKAFKANPANRGKACDAGLWRYSRHPNYFFEWTIWVAYAVMAVSAPWGWLAWTAPAVILFLLLKVSGIPLTERYSLASRGKAYEAYQQRTSAFIPWPPKK
jgi:steroid 5-alpha reductase family enzyme